MIADADLPWLAGPRARLEAMIGAGRLPHGLLIEGVAGVGKSRLGEWLVMRLLCESEEAGVCGACRGCRLAAAGSHPDQYRPALKGERAATLGVDAIRELADFLRLASQYGGARVALVDPADAMTTQAANALLKVLEEPPNGAFLVLVTARAARLPSTVPSRCQRVAVPLPSPEVARTWLTREAPAAVPLLPLVGGAPLYALQLAEAGGGERVEALSASLGAVARGERSPVAVAAEWSQRPGEELLPLLQRLVFQLARRRVTGDETQYSATLAADAIPFAQLMRYLDEVNGRRRASEQPLNEALLAEDLLIGWARLCRGGMRNEHG